MDIIIRQQALEQGLTHYFTGIPCRNGHVSVRGVKKWNCLECDRNQKAAERVRDPERVRANERRTAGKHREKKAQYVRDWRKANPEYDSIKGKERWHAIKSDTVTHAAHNEQMRSYWMNRRRQEGALTRSEFHGERYQRAVEKAEAIGLVRIIEPLPSEGRRRVQAVCNFCGESAITELNGLVNGQGIQCKCRKYGESTLGNVSRMVADGLVGVGAVYVVQTTVGDLFKYGISSNLGQRMASHRHTNITKARKPAWSHTFATRWQSCLWEMAIADMYAEKHDRHFGETPGATEVVNASLDGLLLDAALIACEVDALTADTWEAWALKRIRKAAVKLVA
jgi:predicted GIY-YIG superfamily endonuclease